LSAHRQDALRADPERASAWAETAHKIKNCLCTMGGSLQLVWKQPAAKDKKMRQLLTLISEEAARLDVLTRELLRSGGAASHRARSKEMAALVKRAAKLALESLGMKDSVGFEIRKPVSRDSAVVDADLFLWAWVSLMSAMFRWVGAGGTVAVTLSTFEHRNRAGEPAERVMEVQLLGKRVVEASGWAPPPDLREAFHGDLGEPSLKLVRKIIERHGGEIEVSLESRRDAVVQVILPAKVNGGTQNTSGRSRPRGKSDDHQ